MDSAHYSVMDRLFYSALTAFFVGCGISCTSAVAHEDQVARIAEKRIIGPTTIIAEADSELDFKARVDTGATTTSMHVEEWSIEDESPEMANNVGKPIRILVKNHRGESQWINSRIEEIGTVKTSEQAEDRYKVELTLCWSDVKKRVLVTLNDRSQMKYPMLIGRNFLEGDFVVDVDLKKHITAEIVQIVEKSTKSSPPTDEIAAEPDPQVESLQ